MTQNSSFPFSSGSPSFNWKYSILRNCLSVRNTDYCFLLWGPQHREDMDVLEPVKRRVTNMIRGMEHFSYGRAERAGVVPP